MVFQACNPTSSVCDATNDGKFYLAQYNAITQQVTNVRRNLATSSFAISSSMTLYEDTSTPTNSKIYVGGNILEEGFYETAVFVLSTATLGIEQIAIR